MTQPAATHTSGSDVFLTYDPPIAGTSVLAPGVLCDADGNILDGRTRVITVSPTVSVSPAYTAKDAVGGLLTFASAVESASSAGTITSVSIVDKGQQMAALDLVLFNQTFTASTDNAIFAPSDADLLNSVGVIPISAYHDFSTNSIGVARNVGLAVKLTGTSLFGQLVTRDTPTYTSTGDIQVTIAIKAD